MNLKLSVWDGEKVNLIDIACDAFFPEKVIAVTNSSHDDISAIIAIPLFTYLTVDNNGKVWIDYAPRDILIKLFYHNGELISEKEATICIN